MSDETAQNLEVLTGDPQNPALLTASNPPKKDRLMDEAQPYKMKKVRDIPLWPLWINPEHQIKTAIVLMRGHNVQGLGVKDGEKFIGVVFMEDIIGLPENETIDKHIRRDIESVTLDTSLRKAAEIMGAKKLPRVPVIENDIFFGILNAQDILQDLGKNYDPLTQLPWSDTLREWAIRQLTEGKEICIIFFDLDDFGNFNKKYGHLVGDLVLRRVSDAIKEEIEDVLEVPCRYGGDEFAIATLRSREQSEKLAERIKNRISTITLPDAPTAVSASVGIRGGKRTKSRPNEHPAATLDNLINLASKAAINAKIKRQDFAAKTTPEFLAPQILSVNADEISNQQRVIVLMQIRDEVITATHIGATSIAEGAAFAALSLLKERQMLTFPLEITDVIETESPSGKRSVTLMMRKSDQPIAATETVADNPGVAAVKALLKTIL